MIEKMCGTEVNVRTVTYLLEKAFMEADPPVERKRIKMAGKGTRSNVYP